MSADHDKQRHHCSKMIEHLETARAYCDMMWTCAEDIPENALLADIDPYIIDELIEDARYQLSLIGAEWASIECSVCPDKEF